MANHTKIIALAALALLVLGLSSCQGGSSPTGKVFSGGTNGLLLSFEQDTPPSLIYDNGQTPFSIIVKAKNDGEFDTDNVIFKVSGINTNDFKNLKTSTTYADPIMGRTTLQDQQIDGEEAYIPIGDDTIKYAKSLKGGGELSFNVIVDACYPYATLATSKVCLQNNYLDGDNQACDPKTTSEISVSGAPVQITSFSQQAIGQHKLRLQYTFEVKSNVDIWAPVANAQSGGGLTITTDNCHPTSRTERVSDRNWIYVELDDNNRNGGTIDCVNLQQDKSTNGVQWNGAGIKDIKQSYLTGNAIIVKGVQPKAKGYVKLGSDNKATVTCTMDVPPDIGDSEGTVDVLATYYVGDSLSKQISVTHTDATN